jgi:hypothetical protein
MKATHLFQGLRQPDSENLSIYHVVKKNKEKKETQRETENQKKAEAIRTRPNCLKFLLSKEWKLGSKNLENKGKQIFFEGIIWKKGSEGKKESKLKQIYMNKEKTQRNIRQ